MSRRVVLIPLIAAAAVAAAVFALAVWRQVEAGPVISRQALGVWQERTATRPLRLTVSSADGQADAVEFWVTSPGASTPLRGRLDGDSILVLGENAQDVLWVITYDEGADALLIARPSGAERHVLRRISR